MTAGVGGSTAKRELATLSVWAPVANPISVQEFAARRERIKTLLGAANIDAVLVTAGSNLRYFAGVAWSPSERLVALLIPANGDPVFVCPEFERASLEIASNLEADILGWEEHESPAMVVQQLVDARRMRTLALDPAIDFGGASAILSACEHIDVIDATPVLRACRSVKSASEIALLAQAKAMTLEVHRRVARILHEGISTATVREFIDAAHRRLGASGSSFCIVLFGEATVHPHGVPYEQRLQRGDVVLIDTGCRVEGYHSDITRTYVFGEPDGAFCRLWSLERDAQLAAFAAATPGASCEAVDIAARAVLESGGLGPGYALPGLPHRTGHGVGLDIHESPNLVRGDQTVLQEGMCFSNEPMIVIPGQYGIRLEDHFYIAKAGPAWFTEPAKSADGPFN